MNRSFRHRIGVLEAAAAAAAAAAQTEQVGIDQAFDETDADALDDDTLVTESYLGLMRSDNGLSTLTFIGGTLKVLQYWSTQHTPVERYWTRVAERAGALLQARGVAIFPITREDVEGALVMIDAGVLTCRPLSKGAYRSHHTTLVVPHGDGFFTPAHKLRDRLAHALDELRAQQNAPFIQTVAELRADLVVAIGDIDQAAASALP